MEPLHLAHLIALCLSGGLVLGETVVEFAGRDSLRAVATLHYWMDLLVELPLIAVVLVTGGMLTARASPLSHLHLVKIACGLVAIGLNLYCVGLVIARYRLRDDAAELQRLSRSVLASGIGLPFAAVAACIGLVYFRG